MANVDKKKCLPEENRLYSVLMDEYYASKNIAKVVENNKEQYLGNGHSGIDIIQAFGILINELEKIYRDQMKLEEYFLQEQKFCEVKILARNKEIVKKSLEAVKEAYTGILEVGAVFQTRQKKKSGKRLKNELKSSDKEFQIPLF